jgi:tRNA1(Val) A37 N6-methylase TrmN6
MTNTSLNLEKFVVNDELIIDKSNWKDINDNFLKDEIKQSISDIIKLLPLPYQKIDLQDVIDDTHNLIKLDSQSLFDDSEWFTRYDYKYPISNKLIKICKVGNKSSNYFHQKNRWKCDSINSPSPERTWQTEKFRLTLLNGLWTLNINEINNTTLKSCIALRKYIASQFRPSAAKAIYDYFEAENVLDFSSGWGDRLSGFFASDKTKHYCGVDPNDNLTDGYSSQYNQYMDIRKYDNLSKKYEQHTCPFEDLKLDYTEYFDLVFTSPPYFRVERYTQNKNQSWKRYKKIDEWLEHFLFSSLKKSWNTLKVGGHMAINISDVYMNHTINKICDPMNDFIKDNLGGKNFQTIGYQMGKRPNSKSDKGGLFCEPIWIWQKTK